MRYRSRIAQRRLQTKDRFTLRRERITQQPCAARGTANLEMPLPGYVPVQHSQLGIAKGAEHDDHDTSSDEGRCKPARRATRAGGD